MNSQMRVATVTLNPAIDMTVSVADFRPNHVNRSQSVRFDAGGKGVNVAAILADYGIDTVVTGFLGDQNATIFENLFAEKGIADHFVRLSGYTRTNVKLIDAAQQQTTDVNMAGLIPTSVEIDQLLATIDQLAATCNWFVLAGNLPADIPTNIYNTIIARIKAHDGCRIVLDTSRAALKTSIAAAPHIVKPNREELGEIIGRILASEADTLTAAQQLLEHDIDLAVVSLGGDGAIFVESGQAIHADPPAVTVKSTVGAGDAMVAGIVAGLGLQMSLPETARLATGFAAAAITRIGSHLPSPDILQSYIDQVVIRPLDSQAVLNGRSLNQVASG